MRHSRFLLATGVCAALSFVMPAGNAKSMKQIHAIASKSVLLIKVERTGAPGEARWEPGSGVIISPDGRALAADHVVCNTNIEVCSKYRIVVHQGARNSEPLTAKIINRNEPSDVVLLQLQPPARGSVYGYADVGNAWNLNVTDPIYLAGFPEDQEFRVADGRVSNYLAERNFWLVQVPGNPGDSGGPIFDSDGQVVGLLAGATRGGDQLDRMIPSHLFYALLERHPGKTKPSPQHGINAILAAVLASVDRTVQRARGVAGAAAYRGREAEGWGNAGVKARDRTLEDWDGYARLDLPGRQGNMVYLGAVTAKNGALLANGVGERRQPAGAVYRGQFHWNSASGSGTLTDARHAEFSGIWGKGQLRFGVATPDPRKPDHRQLGSFAPLGAGYALNGFGAIENTRVQGVAVSRLYGEFERGELNGFGVMQFPDGTQWKGEWKHNKLNGVGAKFRKGASAPYEQGYYIAGKLCRGACSARVEIERRRP